MNKHLVTLILTLLIVSCGEKPTYDLVIQNANLFDGYNNLGIVNIAINKDTIAVITSEQIIGDSTIDDSGKFIIPGLVNAHVHASSIEQLKQGYKRGIMYLLNMHTGLEAREQEWKIWSRDSNGYSLLYGSGHAATVPGGHPTQFSPEMETINDSISVPTWVDNRISNGADYIKLIHVNRGWLGDPAPPSLSYEAIGQIIQYTHSKNYKAVIHATTVEEIIELAKYKPDGFVHMIDFKDELPVPEEYYQKLKESGAFIVTTGGISLKSMDGVPPFITEWVNENLLDAEQRAEIIKKYHENGILIVAGTDAQEGQMNFEDDYFLELDLYKLSGLSNLEILKAATGNAATAFNLPIGDLKVGSRANFVVLNASPLDDISNIKEINQIWKNGQRLHFLMERILMIKKYH
ncbi:amidohydrolase family protein [Chondrinema litorale]|uniref:amidohydrolase family protein n=1 Tax=Chondrinema litorale TaxID=2994555 RepID=UPI0025430412|nr:amidohydrolase family protein [Chondrinema litorale]UZR96330.1 amidohydrolase family protein [Chondrinema litorale]